MGRKRKWNESTQSTASQHQRRCLLKCRRAAGSTRAIKDSYVLLMTLLVSCLLAVLAVQAEALAQWGIGGLNIECDLKAQIEALVLSGSIEPLPLSSHQKDWQGASEPKPAPDLEDLTEPAEPDEPEPTAPAAPVEVDGVLKQKVVLLLSELVSIIESKDESGFRHLLTVTLANGDRNQGYDSVWQSQVLTYVCRRYGLTIKSLPDVLSKFERDQEVQALLRSYSVAMEKLRSELTQSVDKTAARV